MKRKMNWDRVRQTKLVQDRGSEWLLGEEKGDEREYNLRMSLKTGKRCTCGFKRGAKGLHKESCPLGQAIADHERKFRKLEEEMRRGREVTLKDLEDL